MRAKKTLLHATNPEYGITLLNGAMGRLSRLFRALQRLAGDLDGLIDEVSMARKHKIYLSTLSPAPHRLLDRRRKFYSNCKVTDEDKYSYCYGNYTYTLSNSESFAHSLVSF